MIIIRAIGLGFFFCNHNKEITKIIIAKKLIELFSTKVRIKIVAPADMIKPTDVAFKVFRIFVIIYSF